MEENTRQFKDWNIVKAELDNPYKKTHYIHLNNVKEISNSDLVLLLNQIKRWLKRGIELKFINVKDDIRKVIKKMGLEDMFY